MYLDGVQEGKGDRAGGEYQPEGFPVSFDHTGRIL